MTTQPKLSELIRKGAAMVDGRQAFGDFIKYDGEGNVCLCAIGAAYYALTGELPKSYLSPRPDDYKNAYDTVINGGVHFPEFRISHLNDELRMTHEEIAAALEEKGL